MTSQILKDIWKVKLIYDIKRKKFNHESLNKFDLYERINIFSSLNEKQQILLFESFFQKEVIDNTDIPAPFIFLSLSFKINNKILKQSLFTNYFSGEITELFYLKKAINKFKIYKSLQSESDFIDSKYRGFSINYMPFTDFGKNRRDDNVYILLYNNFKNKKEQDYNDQFDIIKEQGFKNFLLCLSHINIFYYIDQHKDPKDKILDILNTSKVLSFEFFPNNKNEITDYFNDFFLQDFINQSLSHTLFSFKEKIKENHSQNKLSGHNNFLWVNESEVRNHMALFGTTGNGMSSLDNHQYHIWFVLRIFNQIYSQNKDVKYFSIDNNEKIFKDLWDIAFLNYNPESRIYDTPSIFSEFIKNTPKEVSLFNYNEKENILNKILKEDVLLKSVIVEKSSYLEKALLHKNLTSHTDIQESKKRRI